jgi:hypothetical protein
MIELNQKEIEAVSGGTFGLIGKIVSFKIGVIQSFFGGHSKPPVCKPPVDPCKPVVVDPCKPTCPPPAPGCDDGPGQGDF